MYVILVYINPLTNNILSFNEDQCLPLYIILFKEYHCSPVFIILFNEDQCSPVYIILFNEHQCSPELKQEQQTSEECFQKLSVTLMTKVATVVCHIAAGAYLT